MDPQVVAGLATGLLVLLGARRQRANDGSPTAGEQVAAAGQAVSSASAGVVRQVGSATASFTVGAGEVAVMTASWAGAGITRLAANASTQLAAVGVGATGELAARTGGLVVDGMLAVRDGMTTALGSVRRRSPAESGDS